MKNLLFLSVFFLSLPAFAEIENIAVVGSDNTHFNSTYSKNASQLATSLISQKKKVLCVGTGMGPAGAFLKTMDNKKGDFIAVSYQGIDETNCPKNHPCQTIAIQQKASVKEQADFFITQSDALVLLPGGFEIMYIFNYLETLIQDRKIPYKPVVFLNTNHFWDRANEMLTEMKRQNILSKEILETIAFENKPNNVLKTIEKLQKNIEKIQRDGK